jgi:hypothetical protein
VKVENGDLHADSHNILNRWKNYFFQLFNVHFSDVRQIEVHTAEPLVLVPVVLKLKLLLQRLQVYITSSQQEANCYCPRSTNSLILFGIRKNCVISGRSLLLYQFTKRVIKLTVIIIVGYHCYLLNTKFYQMSSQG